jgi:hypothetical protein
LVEVSADWPWLIFCTRKSGNTLHHAAKAKRVIYLFQSGGPSQIDLFDHKPRLNEETGKELPDSVRKGQRLTGMSGNQASLPLVGSPFKFSQHGQSGQWISELLPNTAKVADDMCIVNSMYTEAINHGPGCHFHADRVTISRETKHGGLVIIWLGFIE